MESNTYSVQAVVQGVEKARLKALAAIDMTAWEKSLLAAPDPAWSEVGDDWWQDSRGALHYRLGAAKDAAPWE